MNRLRVRLMILILGVLAITWGAYSRRVRIWAWMWHLQHGTALNIGNCVVPVPTNWYVEGQANGDQLLVRIDTSDQTPYKRLKAHASILLLSESPLNDMDLSRLTSLDLAFLKQHGVETVLQRTFSVESGSISCVGGYKLDSKGIDDIEPISWLCKSSVGLQILVSSTDPDMNQVWEIVSGIRKKS